MPGNVRAAYFETAASPEALRGLCSFISPDLDVLADTYSRVAADAVAYLDFLGEATSYNEEEQLFAWPKFGDIQIVFKADEYRRTPFVAEYRNAKSAAWYLAKDEVIVPDVGLVYVDLESATLTFPSVDETELALHHDLYVLHNVLRDHVRVLANSATATAPFGPAEGPPPDDRGFARIRRSRYPICKASNRSRMSSSSSTGDTVATELAYDRLGVGRTYRHPLAALGPQLAPL